MLMLTKSGVSVCLSSSWLRTISYNNTPVKLPTGNRGILPPFIGETVVVGTFNSFDAVLTSSHQAIYSEMHIGVDRVLYPSDFTISGTTIDIFVPGGCVALPNGKTLAYKNPPRPYGLVQGGRYLLFLTHAEPGDFYLLGDSIMIENGAARPNSPDAVNAVKASAWPFLGLSEDDLANKISTLLTLQHPSGR
jgi:hypothetical protein